MYTIGELSRRTGVKVPTIRWYEQAGLVDAPDRTEGNQRRYARGDLERLSFIRHARDLGFDLEAIRQLIELSGHPEKPCAHADAIADSQLADVRDKIAKLKRLETELERMAKNCAHGTAADCYVLRSLADHELCEAEH
jgi:DNA-binding transcriptional MerR regulator